LSAANGNDDEAKLAGEAGLRAEPAAGAASRMPTRKQRSSGVERSDRNEDFERLAMPLFDSLYNFARWLTHNDGEAEDLVQETYLKALNGFDSFTLGTDFRAWIFRILRNAFLNSRSGLRAKLTQALEPEDQEVVAIWETPESLALAAATRERLQAALEQLPVAYREVILLCDVEEMKYQEIADVLGVPIGTVMSRLARGRRRLRTILEEDDNGRQKRVSGTTSATGNV
jgi:RNA polymerase sigma factor (sigma-70 family)